MVKARNNKNAKTGVLDSFGAGIDRLIGVFSPSAELRRMQARGRRALVAELERKRTYAAAKTNQLTGDWFTLSSNVNTEIGGSLSVINGRVRQLVRDMPHAAIALNRVVDLTVGKGLELQSRVKDPFTEKLDKKLNRQIEDAWKWWSDEAMADGMHLMEAMALGKRQDCEIGAFFLIKRATRDRNRFLPAELQLVESDQLVNWMVGAPGWPVATDIAPGNSVAYGVEYKPATGRPEAFHLTEDDPGGVTINLNYIRIKARDAIHGYKRLRPGQLRGVSAFAPAVLLAHQFRDFLEAEIDAAKLAARDLAYVSTPDPSNFMRNAGVQDDGSYTPSRKIEDRPLSITHYLLPTEEVELAEHNRPGSSFDPFSSWVVRTFAGVLDLSYELVSNDYRGLNYAVLRGVRNDVVQNIRVHTTRHVRQFCEPVRRYFMDWCVLTGRLDLPGYWKNPWPYLRGQWQGPGAMPVDPLKEGRADADAVKNLLKSPQEVLLSRGRDPEEMLDEHVEWNEMKEDRGLETDPTSTATQTNPAALAAGKRSRLEVVGK